MYKETTHVQAFQKEFDLVLLIERPYELMRPKQPTLSYINKIAKLLVFNLSMVSAK